MCGRYTIAIPPEQLAERFNATLPAEPLPARYNAAPGQQLPILLNENQDQRPVQLVRWGLIPYWAKDHKTDYRMINARSETLEDKPAFRKSLHKRRCLVLADSFYEWQKTPDGKVPTRILLKSGEPFAMAGLWETWTSKETGEVIRSFTIITTEPNDLMASIHNRMPVILPPEHEDAWIAGEDAPKDWRDLLRPYPADLMKAYPVSTLVNSMKNDSVALIAPA
jgi:putative SOS response-associated peptidase YedK